MGIIPDDCSGMKIRRAYLYGYASTLFLRDIALSVGVPTVRHMYVIVVNSVVEVCVGLFLL